MTPSLAPMNTAHLHLLDAELTRDCFLRDSLRAQVSNLHNVGLSKLNQWVANPTIVGAMVKLIGHVLYNCSPIDMMRRTASFLTFSAKMPDMVSGGWAGSSDDCAQDRRDKGNLPFVSHVAVSVVRNGIWPLQALGLGMLEDNVAQKRERLAVRRLLATLLDRAYRGFSHSSLLTGSGWLERAAMFQHPARSLFVSPSGVAV